MVSDLNAILQLWRIHPSLRRDTSWRQQMSFWVEGEVRLRGCM